MKKYYLGLAAAFMLLNGCVAETSDFASTEHTFDSFSASIEDSGTKVQVSPSGNVEWSVGDRIGVFGDDREPVCFTYEEDGCFHGAPVSGSTFTAYYPWDMLELQDNTLVTKDGWPIAAFDTWVSPSSIVMTARSSGNHLVFRQTCGLIHFHVSGSGIWTSAGLVGNMSEELCTGGSIDLDEDIPVFTSGKLFNYTMWLFGNWDAADGYDIYFPIAPKVLEKGFTLTLYGQQEGQSHVNATSKRVSVERGRMLTYNIDTDGPEHPYVYDDSGEREALIAFYNAMDGPNWKNNDNWCTDRPLNEWYGVNVGNTGIDMSCNEVVSLWMIDNGLKGTVPPEISGLKDLRYLCLLEQEGDVDYSGIKDLPKLEFLRLGLGFLSYPANNDLEKQGTIPSGINTLDKLTDFEMWGFKGPIPATLFEMDNLKNVRLEFISMDGGLPEGFGRMNGLEYLSISGCPSPLHKPSGPIPDDIWDCPKLNDLSLINMALSGELSPKIKQLASLNSLSLGSNKLSGALPKELTELNLDYCELRFNDFSGEVPAEFDSWPAWRTWWCYIVEGTKLDFGDHAPLYPEFTVSTIDGSTFSSSSVLNNKLTAFYSWASWCPYVDIIPTLKTLYEDYKDRGFEVVSYSYEDEDTVRSHALDNNMPWVTFANVETDGSYPLVMSMYPTNSFPCIMLYNQDGQLVYYHIGVPNDLSAVVRGCFGEGPDPTYVSSDYSADGAVHTLLTASEGAGIDVILMGDCFSDRLISDGTYAAAMERACDALFVEEPFKSFHNCFNVSYVDVVSRNEVYTGSTTLNTWYGEDTEVGGNDQKVFEYADKVLKPAGKSADDALIIVLMNRDYHAGTCYMYSLPSGDYGRGASIAYVPTDSADENFGKVLRHEAGGHGFAKLADEYGYIERGTIPADVVKGYKQAEQYGWWKNIDFTSDLESIKWSAFLDDIQYSVYQQLAAYEGGATYWTGVWRPTPDSIMNTGNDGFNAPSRYAIWYRIGKLAYGEGWNGSLEDFLSYDAINITIPEWAQAPKRNITVKSAKPISTTPPVVIGNWK